MADLPALAQALDDSRTCGAWMGSGCLGLRWQLVLDFDVEEPEYTDTRGLAEFVQPMTLDGITVADDAQFLGRLAERAQLAGLCPPGSAGALWAELADWASPQRTAEWQKRMCWDVVGVRWRTR